VRTLIACAVALYATLASAYALTEGFAVFTSEDARRLTVQRTPQILPNIKLLDATGQAFDLHELSQGGRKVVLLDFFFTRCESICRVLGSQFQRLQSQIVQRGLQDQISLLSISFDPNHDTPQALADYAKRMHADPALWRFAAPVSAANLAVAQRAFDIVVIADPLLIYQHNAAIHVLDDTGKLARIIDYDAVDVALDAAISLRSVPLVQAP
jgi:protein SCO1